MVIFTQESRSEQTRTHRPRFITGTLSYLPHCTVHIKEWENILWTRPKSRGGEIYAAFMDKVLQSYGKVYTQIEVQSSSVIQTTYDIFLLGV